MAQPPNSAAATKAPTAGVPVADESRSPNRTAASSGRPVYLVDGARTPFLRARHKPGPFTPVDLAVQCGRPLLLRQPFSRNEFDVVILGCVNVIADEMNPARVAALRLGMGAAMTAFTVQINCGSGMQSIDIAFRAIEAGSADLILAGGTEALSHAPLVLRQHAVEWFGGFTTAKTPWEKATALAGLRPEMARPVVGLERGLTDPITDLNMGQTAEVIGHLFGITREAADTYALESHQRLERAQNEGFLAGEVIPAISRNGMLYDHDDGVRPDTSMDKLAKLQAVFEKPYGNVTAGNSSQVTDGACWVVLASEDAMNRHKLAPLARIVDSEWSALDPSIMGLAPTLCSTEIMKRRKLSRDDIDLWELNEAFAAQVLACLAAWENEEYCRDVLGLDGIFGRIERVRLNVDGGAISLGHPVGTSGNRLVLHLANAMRRLGVKRGIATECIGGGQGGAMLLEVV
ncbi:acetyl-CoA C-acetyltransferase [Sinorhizobium terangae]|uniref:Acetyl-CoA C-acetyltransferase n=1 Tax=Sinorhizobium terangae TaxID=110322 RepID=A0A6N7LAX8_SINTE|nr:acetyl-CoA C-acetyltransferase [Sinorhizobium terangae]MBB4187019.1 acetyl-CoA C-acetyltransferase [Sinorhizobium terangae]MQX14349.1 acetyl-CoA C-acetyltransferase [Sinorhizobium terangae]WFU49938.1 acetyl-CoA C-acetyltransferase [Sinorhizobium terangae]